MEADSTLELQEKSECVAIPLDQEEDRIDSSTPHPPSGFLCPSNFGALLESTTVSLVSGGWKETASIRKGDGDERAELSVDQILEDGSESECNACEK